MAYCQHLHYKNPITVFAVNIVITCDKIDISFFYPWYREFALSKGFSGTFGAFEKFPYLDQAHFVQKPIRFNSRMQKAWQN